MTTLGEIFDYEAFVDATYQGYIRVQTHPEFSELSIANYSEKSQYERHWTPEILASRGLIYNNQTLEVIARGFPKFFNWDDSGQPYPPKGPMVLSTKFDGSLGILYRTPTGDTRVATRGSFASDQALHATARLHALGLDDLAMVNAVVDYQDELELTILVEIIYPGNRIVVDYHGEDRLVLLDVVSNVTGLSDLTAFDNLPWDDRAEKRLIAGGFTDGLTHDIPQGEEGFVLYFPGNGFRCKMKSAEYVELHRMVTGLSKRSVWELISQGKTTNEIKENIPDELFAFVDETVRELNDMCSTLVDDIYEDFDAVIAKMDAESPIDTALTDETRARLLRSRFARHAQSFVQTRPYLFLLWDDKQPEDIWKAVWKTLKPVGDTRAWGRLEDAEE